MSGNGTRDDLAELIAATDIDEDAPRTAERQIDTVPMVLFRAGGRWYGVVAEHVREVVSKDRIARVPAMPAHILGVALVHGRLIPVVDIAAMLGAADSAAPDNARLLVLEGGDAEVSVVADEACGVINLPLPPHAANAELVRGEVGWNEQLVCVLDGPALVVGATAELAE
jgi:chemotaxis signal transduction protein